MPHQALGLLPPGPSASPAARAIAAAKSVTRLQEHRYHRRCLQEWRHHRRCLQERPLKRACAVRYPQAHAAQLPSSPTRGPLSDATAARKKAEVRRPERSRRSWPELMAARMSGALRCHVQPLTVLWDVLVADEDEHVPAVGAAQGGAHRLPTLREAAKATTETVDALRTGAAAMKAMQKAGLDVAQVRTHPCSEQQQQLL